jgi:hypothetical protein
MIITTRSSARIRLIGLGAADVVALVVLRPDWDALGREVTAPHRWVAHSGPDGAIGTLCAAALWLAAVWLAIGLAAAALSTAPGRLGAWAHQLARQLLPATVQRVLAVTAGLSLLAAAAPAGAASPPGPSGRATTAVAGTPAWPTTGPPLTHLSVSWPVTAPTASTAPATSTPPVGRTVGPVSADAGPRTVVVGPGDSLWALAAHHLGADPAPARIAATWPRWYAANRALIGPDPGRLRPGQVLVIPPATGPPGGTP